MIYSIEYYKTYLVHWKSKHDNLHSFCLIVLHQGLEKGLILLVGWMRLPLDRHLQNAIITILVSIFVLWVSLPLCYNTFLNLAQALPQPHVELLRHLKRQLVEKLAPTYRVSDSQFWLLDMSYIVGNLKVVACGQSTPSEDTAAIVDTKALYSAYIAELAVELEPPLQRSAS